jgi:hypothetical protein
MQPSTPLGLDQVNVLLLLFANFDPTPGLAKECQVILFFPKEFALEFADVQD